MRTRISVLAQYRLSLQIIPEATLHTQGVEKSDECRHGMAIFQRYHDKCQNCVRMEHVSNFSWNVCGKSHKGCI